MNKYSYVTKLEVKYDHLEVVDIPKIVEENPHKWFNESLTTINDSVARIGIVEGEYHWHKHDEDDEFFHLLNDWFTSSVFISPLTKVFPVLSVVTITLAGLNSNLSIW